MELSGEHKTIPVNSILARIDPRLKLLLTLLVIAAVFSTIAWLPLFLLASVVIVLLVDSAALVDFRQRLLWLKWFFCFILILHVLLSPGHTLFGVAWLSYDGLLRGLQVVFQVITSLGFSLALTRSTSPEQLTAATASLLKPFSLFGLNIDMFSSQILMTLHFVPILRLEGADALQKARDENPQIQGRGLVATIQLIQVMVMPLFLRLISRADVLAENVAAGDETTTNLIHLSEFWPIALVDRMAICYAAIVAIVFLGLR